MTCYRFGDGYELDDRTRELRRQGELVEVQPLTFEFLLYLIRHRDRVVSSDELRGTVWNGVYVEQNSVNHALMKARAAVGDGGSQQHTIKTSRTQGFRFVQPVEEVTLVASPASPSIRAPAAEPRAPAGSPFVGRESSMSVLKARLDAALEGAGQVVIVSGEAGIGKTRVADELAASAREDGARVLVGRCHDGGDVFAFLPWRMILRSLAEADDVKALLAGTPEVARELALIAPDIAAVAPPSESALAPSPARFRLFDAVARFLHAASSLSPLLIVIEDIHWADESSLGLLRFVAHEHRLARILVLVTLRDDSPGRAPALEGVVGGVVREEHGGWIRLPGLSVADVAHLVGAETHRDVPPTLAAALHERTGGNAFFLTQLLATLSSSGGDLEALVAVLPNGMREAIGRHLAPLSPACREALVVASVLGREFEQRLLASITKLPAPALFALLDEAIRARLLAPVAERRGRYRFAHALIRDALYDDIPLARRAHLHGAAADVLEAWYRDEVDLPLDEVAHHLVQAATAGMGRRAIAACIAAAKQAIARTAFEAGSRLYQQALDLMDLDEPSASLRLELLLGLGDAQRRLGERIRAEQTFRQARTLARTPGASEQLAAAVLGTIVLGNGASPDPERTAWLEEALAALGPAETPLRIQLVARLAESLVSSGQLDRARDLGAQAVAMARRHGDLDLLAWSLAASHWWTPPSDEHAAMSSELIAITTRTRDIELRFAAVLMRRVEMIETGDVKAADAHAGELARLANEIAQPLYHFYEILYSASSAFMEGRFADVEAHIASATEIGVRAAIGADGLVNTLLFGVRLLQGRLSEISEPIRAFLRDYPAIAGLRVGLAWDDVGRGDVAAARSLVAELTADGLAAIHRDYNWLGTVALLAELAAEIGAADAAADMYQLMLPHRHRQPSVGAGLVPLGSASRYLGLLASLQRRWDDAERHFADALEMNTRMGARAFVAQVEHDVRAMLLRRERGGADRARATELGRRTEEAARAMGMAGLARRAGALKTDG